MFIESMNVDYFRHVRQATFGPFREASDASELIVLAGRNGRGKSSILELLSFGLTTRYSWQYQQSRRIFEHRVGIKIGLSPEEIRSLLGENPPAEVSEFIQRHKGYVQKDPSGGIGAPAQTTIDGFEDEQIRLGEWEEQWTGEYIFENEWQTFRTKSDRSLELKTPCHECEKGRYKIAVKVVDIFGNDTMKIIEVAV